MIPDIVYRIRCSVDGLRNERGAALVEWSLLVALIAVISIAALKLLGGSISSEYSDINSTFVENT